jgi:hypothetical protein
VATRIGVADGSGWEVGGGAVRVPPAWARPPQEIDKIRQAGNNQRIDLMPGYSSAFLSEFEAVLDDQKSPTSFKEAGPLQVVGTDYVPSSQEFRYRVCSCVSASIFIPIASSLRRAISRSIASGIVWTPFVNSPACSSMYSAESA